MPYEKIVEGMYIDTLGLVPIEKFRKFIKGVTDQLDTFAKGKAFLAEFAPGVVTGADRYPGAMVLFKPPHPFKQTSMQSIAEAEPLRFYQKRESSMIGACVGQEAITAVTVGSMQEHEDWVVDKVNYPKILEKLKKVKDYQQIALIIPAFSEAESLAELLMNTGGKVVNMGNEDTPRTVLVPPGEIVSSFNSPAALCKSLFLCFELKTTSLGKGKQEQGPVQIWTYYPGAQIKATPNNKDLAGQTIGQDGKFTYQGTTYYMDEVILHELIHAYHFVKGSGELDPQTEDEKRAVGIYGFKGSKYSENVFRAWLKKPLRPGYETSKIPPDPEVAGFDFLKV